MDKGHLIYRDQSSKWIMFLILIMGILLDFVCIWEEDTINIIGFLFCTLFLVVIPYLAIKDIRNKPGFYEQGVGYFKNNRCTHWVPYHHFKGLECYINRDRFGQPAKTPTYGLVFYQADGSFVQLRTQSLDRLKQHWKAIIVKNPHLRTQLKPYELKGVAIASSEQMLPRRVHPASQLLFNVLTAN